MPDYAGVIVRSDTLLRAGLKYFGDLKGKVMGIILLDSMGGFFKIASILQINMGLGLSRFKMIRHSEMSGLRKYL